MDLMFALSEDGVHDVMWTDRLLDEWERVIVRERQRSADAAAAISVTIREFFADTLIPEAAYLDLVESIDGPDPDDCFHIAAAIAAQVSTLITWNIADFQSPELDRNGVVVTDPDTYLQGLLAEIPDEVVATVRRLAAGKRRPPMMATDLTDALAKAGVPQFAGAIRERLSPYNGNDA